MRTYFLMILTISLKFSHAFQACGNPNEPLHMPLGDLKEGKSVCPVKTDGDKRKLEELSQQNYEMDYCLWDDMLTTPNENSCQYEVNPVFRKYEDKEQEPIPCGSDRNQFLHYFGYYYCGDEIVLDRFRKFVPPKNQPYEIEIRKSKIIAMYNVCFDINNNTPVWTVHSLETPQLLQDPSNEQDYCETEIRKDPFFTDKNFFPNLEKKYESAGKKDATSEAVLPQPLVPSTHFASRLGKKATNHYINRKPLWDKLVPLMTVIDQGIKKAVIKTSLEVQRNNPTDKVLIYTKTKPAHAMMARFKKLFKAEPFELFEPNVWYKFIYDPLQRQAVIIYVHNTPGKPVVKKCKLELYCNFKRWTEDQQIQNEITEEELKYAYCCSIDSNEARKEFGTEAKDFNIRYIFDINSVASY